MVRTSRHGSALVSKVSDEVYRPLDLRYEEQIGRTILVDEIDGEMHIDYGALPNSVYLIGKDGVIAHRIGWIQITWINRLNFS